MAQKVPFLSEEEIERDANDLLASYGRARRIDIVAPIPIEDIVEKHLKLGIEFDDMHRLMDVRRFGLEPDILGAMYFEDRRIVIDESLDPEIYPHKEGRYRFTLAHEGGGHWQLHRELFGRQPGQLTLIDDGPSVICRSSQAKAPVEWQADYYASCLLMPQALVRDAWRLSMGTSAPFIFDPARHGARESARGNGPRPLRTILRNLRKSDSDRLFDEIAGRFSGHFGTSVQAMRIRLENLGLLVREAPRQASMIGAR
jgi:hypothetical protein